VMAMSSWKNIRKPMTIATPSSVCDPDPAALLGAAVSLKKTCEDIAGKERINLSECYNGGDEFMRQVMRVASLFETWCSEYLDFNQFSDVWPYLLEDKFGDAFLKVSFPTCLTEFDSVGCLRVAMVLRLPVRVIEGLPVPVNLTAANPLALSPFRHFQIRTVRRHNQDNDISQYTPSDEPDDDEFGAVFFGLYGLEQDGVAEHIADRDSYAEAVALAGKLAPGIQFPHAPTLLDSFPNGSEQT
jgi:hypothetical protein